MRSFGSSMGSMTTFFMASLISHKTELGGSQVVIIISFPYFLLSFQHEARKFTVRS
jgi:hypothetical protein